MPASPYRRILKSSCDAVVYSHIHPSPCMPPVWWLNIGKEKDFWAHNQLKLLVSVFNIDWST